MGINSFDRDAELEALTERVKDGTHTLLTAQRRMGKTSLVRELLRRLKNEGCFETIFVDLEGARYSSRRHRRRSGFGQSRCRAYSTSSNLGLPTPFKGSSIESIPYPSPRYR